MCIFERSSMNSNKEKAENNAGTETQLNQFKHKRVLLKKFLNEPVDALDLRLAKAEENLSELPIDPFTNIRHEVRILIGKYISNTAIMISNLLKLLFRHFYLVFSHWLKRVLC